LLRALGKLWRQVGEIGADPALTPHLQKKVAVSNHALFLGVVVSIGYAVFYTFAGYPAATAINAVATPLYALALLANHRRYSRLARHAAVVTAHLHIGSLSIFALGASSGAHYWFWMFIIIAYLMFPRGERVATYVYCLLSIALFSGIENGFIRLREEPVLSDELATALRLISTITTLFVITVVIDVFDRETEHAEKAFAREHERSEKLLLNVLPPAIATRLKEDSHSIADGFDEVTVMFADIAGFTSMASSLDPHKVVTLLNDVFSEFDALLVKYGLEKIKTIGDAYMVAGGLPDPRPDHARAVAAMALDMVEVSRRRRRPDGSPFQVRIGINTGPVVAGVIGVKKFIYDLWGDAVNTASRMESQGVAGEIQVTEATYERIKDEFIFEPREPIEVKGKGLMRTWLLKERR